MSFITPEGGWEDPPRPELPPIRKDLSKPTQYVYPAQPQQPQYSFYLRCKVCDRGSLTPQKVFRMSGPAIVIGFILLIPSILGMIISALMFVGIIAYNGGESGIVASQPRQSFQNSFDAGFRRSCARSFGQSYRMAAGAPAPLAMIEQYCECALSVFKETGSQTTAAQTCVQRVKDGSLEAPDQDVREFYSGDIRHEKRAGAAINLFRVIGSGFAVALGIASFVGGLLGWLLVMRKRVLKCDLCGAVVNAS